MSLETTLFTALRGLVNDRVYRDVAPETNTSTDRPYVTFQQIGGKVVNFMSSETLPNRKNARVQVNVWGNDRDGVAALARLVEDGLRPLGSVLSGPVAVTETDRRLYGSRQDFSVWYVDE